VWPCSCRCSTTVPPCIVPSARREARTPRGRRLENPRRSHPSTRSSRAVKCWCSIFPSA
jgi:hypothetical protein